LWTSVIFRVTTFLENLEMSANCGVVRKMPGNWPFVGELSVECLRKILSGKTVVLKEQNTY